LKEATDWYVTTVGISFEELADRTHYAGDANRIRVLTLGTVVEFLTALATAEPRFAGLYRPIEPSVRAITPLRNDISHEDSEAVDLSPVVKRLLELIAEVIEDDGFWRPVIDSLPPEEWG